MLTICFLVGISYIKQNRFDDAIEYLNSADEALEFMYGNENMYVALVKTLLGNAWSKEGSKNKALENYKTAASIISNIKGEDNVELEEIQKKIDKIESSG